MRLLLETHTLLWAFENDPRLSAAAADAITDADNSLWLSPASYWELAIKIGLGKYRLARPLDDYIAAVVRLYDMAVLPLELPHAHVVAGLPHHHKDPFDRMLIAQAIVEDLAIVSRDAALDAYPVTRVW